MTAAVGKRPTRDLAPRVMLACPGLGRINRGYETFTKECFESLQQSTEVEIWLCTSLPDHRPRRAVARSVDRRSTAARLLARPLPGQQRKTPYFVEQASFAVGLIPVIRRLSPDVVFLSDGNIGNILHRLRPLLPGDVRLLLCNGAPEPPPYPSWDHVQHVTPQTLEAALAAGGDPTRHSLVPLGFDLDPSVEPRSFADRAALREALGLPVDAEIVISVGAMSPRKRMAYLVEELGRLSLPRPHLVILGQEDSESAKLRQLAPAVLGAGNVTIRTVSSSQVADYYGAADVFALASLSEGFGRVYVEALAAGLPCVAHRNPTTDYVLGEHGYLADLAVAGGGAAAIASALQTGSSPEARAERRTYAVSRFSWPVLRPDYIELFQRCARAPSRAGHQRAAA